MTVPLTAPLTTPLTNGLPRTSRTRRHDPDRKSRIIDATLDVIAEHGVAGTTHRVVAAAADVPLGSMTYHFQGLTDLLEQAFRRHADRQAELYAQHFDGVADPADLLEALVDLIAGYVGTSHRDWVITYECYTAALRNPALRSITDDWMAGSRAVLQRWLDPHTARGVDALIEGLVMHSMLARSPIARPHIKAWVAKLLPVPLPLATGHLA